MFSVFVTNQMLPFGTFDCHPPFGAAATPQVGAIQGNALHTSPSGPCFGGFAMAIFSRVTLKDLPWL